MNHDECLPGEGVVTHTCIEVERAEAELARARHHIEAHANAGCQYCRALAEPPKQMCPRHGAYEGEFCTFFETDEGNWSKFWLLAKDKGMNKEDVHAYFGLDDGDSLAVLAEERAAEHGVSLQDEIDVLTDVLRTVK